MAKKLSEMTKEERREYNHNLIKESAKIPNVLNVFYKPIYCKECKTELTHNEVRNGSGYCEKCEEEEIDDEVTRLKKEIKQYKFWANENEKVLQATRKSFIDFQRDLINFIEDSFEGLDENWIMKKTIIDKIKEDK